MYIATICIVLVQASFDAHVDVHVHVGLIVNVHTGLCSMMIFVIVAYIVIPKVPVHVIKCTFHLYAFVYW